MKTAIVYASVHHGNTKKLLEGIASQTDVALIDILKNPQIDLSEYDCIGFASGVFFQKLHAELINFIKKARIERAQKIFFILTCGVVFGNPAKAEMKFFKEKGIEILGMYRCRGYDTFGIFGKIGGIAKKHPNNKDIQKGIEFIKKIGR